MANIGSMWISQRKRAKEAHCTSVLAKTPFKWNERRKKEKSRCSDNEHNERQQKKKSERRSFVDIKMRNMLESGKISNWKSFIEHISFVISSHTVHCVHDVCINAFGFRLCREAHANSYMPVMQYCTAYINFHCKSFVSMKTDKWWCWIVKCGHWQCHNHAPNVNRMRITLNHMLRNKRNVLFSFVEITIFFFF